METGIGSGAILLFAVAGIPLIVCGIDFVSKLFSDLKTFLKISLDKRNYM